MSMPNDRLSHENQNRRPSNGKQNLDHSSSQILEHGDIFFFIDPRSEQGVVGSRMENM
jgi:hypothetical protein